MPKIIGEAHAGNRSLTVVAVPKLLILKKKPATIGLSFESKSKRRNRREKGNRSNLGNRSERRDGGL
jgi:hypothetical protein